MTVRTRRGQLPDYSGALMATPGPRDRRGLPALVRARRARTVVGTQAATLACLLAAVPATAAAATPVGRPVTAVHLRPNPLAGAPAVDNFWLASTTGTVWSFDNARPYPAAPKLAGTLADIVPAEGTGGRQGYWLVSTTGEVVARGTTHTFPPAVPGSHPATPVADLTPTADGKGYWLVSANGDVTAYGDARSYGVGHDPASGPGRAVRLVAAPAGTRAKVGGYWLVSADGHVQAFGDVSSYGPGPAAKLQGQVVDMQATADGRGYWELTSLGNVYTYDDAKYYGAHPLASNTNPAEKLVVGPKGGGYWIEDEDGTSWAFGTARTFVDLFLFGQPGSAPLEGLVFRPTTVGDRVAMFALSQIGKRYEYGGTGPDGYDCSGLVYRSYLTVTGRKLPRVAADQYHAGGVQVPLSQLQTGDLLFYSSNPARWQDVSTDAIYVGGGGTLAADVPAVQTESVGWWTAGGSPLPVGVRP